MKLKTLIHNSILFALMFFLNSCSSGPSLDSIDFEKEFDIQIPDDQAENIATVGQAISYIENS